MKRILRLATMSVAALLGGVVSLYLANGYINALTDESAKATVAAGEITLFGVVFSAFYNEVSAYYTEKSANIGKKWELIFPLLKKYYYPWVHVAESVKDSLDRIDISSPTDATVIRYLYNTMVFYGMHYSFIVDDGGIILLSSVRDTTAVQKAYHDLMPALDWDGDNTIARVTYLQSLWRKRKAQPSGDPYTMADFAEDLKKDGALKDDLAVMKKFVSNNKAYRERANKALGVFIATFEGSINNLYNAWSES